MDDRIFFETSDKHFIFNVHMRTGLSNSFETQTHYLDTQDERTFPTFKKCLMYSLFLIMVESKIPLESNLYSGWFSWKEND